MDGGGNDTTTEQDSFSAFTVALSETARLVFQAGSMSDTLAQVAASSVVSIEGCDYAGIFLSQDGAVTTAASTDPIVDDVDGMQHQTGEGPCLHTLFSGLICYVDDLASDSRWPLFGPQAAAKGVRSVLALPLGTTGTIGALNLYARYPSAFGVVDRGKGVILASLAAIALAASHSHEGEARRVENLQRAMQSREVIGQAEGILMERERITADQAFNILRRASQHLNLKLRDVAQQLVDTGEGPDTGPCRSASS
ncbi:MAG TPA: GAF and ANTAR domain-containing protein [Acidimicrobiales bacterium]|nr:GAF and ANTAR domain-containing protein [Acidimicrobiales bacterium]